MVVGIIALASDFWNDSVNPVLDLVVSLFGGNVVFEGRESLMKMFKGLITAHSKFKI